MDKREAVAYHFRLQAEAFGFTNVEERPGYCYQLTEGGCTITALALCESFDFYEYRIFRARHDIDLLIVQKHNAMVPVRVVCLSTGLYYDPHAIAAPQRADAKRANHDEMLLFVSKLILGADSIQEALAAMPDRTRQRYFQRYHQYLRPRRGRPIAS